MTLKKCNSCGNIFNDENTQNNYSLCSKCFKNERQEFLKVRDYLWSNPGADLTELHQKTGVSKKLIQKFIREGRFRKL